MKPFAPETLAVAVSAATLLAYRALRRKNLTNNGAAAGFIVGFLLVATGLRGLNLFVFYQLGSMATKYQSQRKAILDETVSQTSTRGIKQVLAVSVIAVILSLYHATVHGAEQAFTSDHPAQTKLACAILAHHATSLADTWASELGMLSREQPRSILWPFRKVPAGTNGGVTLTGTLWSLLGGACIGISTVILDALSGIQPLRAIRVVVFAGCCGLLGSVIDSILGATLQITYWNETTKQERIS
ncbi:hypothetical protein MPSEU_001031200 [Mayamaea pseudoterrestris]|nr:hypothetical protein MPSEU_001031200 [Mayamaea pseudoterrestris]